MRTTSYLPGRPRPRNGVLVLFLQMPLAAVVGGYLLEVVSLPVASFAVFASSAAFPAWVSHRTAVSEDPREPVHHLHRYAVGALGLVTVCTVAMAAASAVTGVDSPGVWRGLGAELTGEPSSGSWALLAGVVVCTLVATCTVTSAQVLFGRRPGLGRPTLIPVADGFSDAIRKVLGGRRRHARATRTQPLVPSTSQRSWREWLPSRGPVNPQLAVPSRRVGWRSVLASGLSPRRHRRRQSPAVSPMARTPLRRSRGRVLVRQARWANGGADLARP